MADRTLVDYYKQGRQVYLQTESTGASQDAVTGAVAALESALALVETLGLFSSNEEIDDIKTSSLKYLLVPYYLGSLYLQVQIREKRLESLVRGRTLLANFFEACFSLTLVHPSDKAAYDKLGVPVAGGPGVDREAQRSAKIERLKRKKEAERMLTALLGKIHASKQDNPDDEDASLDEEEIREKLLRMVEVYVVSALESLEMIGQEIEILRHMASIGVKPGAPGNAAAAAAQGPPPARKPLQTFTIDKRLQIKRDVFKPSWIQPTLTVEEAGEIELRLAQQRQKEQKDREEAERRRKEEAGVKEVDSDDDDEKLKKTRDWDDWSDQNPKGSGNTGNRGYVYL